MVKIITGKVNAGKTTTLLKTYRLDRKGDGFAAIKKMNGNEVYGYNMLHLSNDNIIPWMVHQKYFLRDFTKTGKFGPFYLNLDLLAMLESIIDELIVQRISPIYLDEVGVLEINGGGYHNILKKLLSSGLDLVITVRDDLVKPVASHFDIKDYELVQVQGEE